MTIKEWLEKLPEPIREKALANANKNPLNDDEPNLWHAISAAFTWGQTREGQEYWSKVSRGINPETGEKLIFKKQNKMKKNFEKLEVGQRYENSVEQVVKIVKNNGSKDYPFMGDNGEYYTPEGQYNIECSDEFDLIELLPEKPTACLAELEATREELDKKIKELKKNTQTLYCGAFFLADHKALIHLGAVRSHEERERGIREWTKDKAFKLITTFDLPFRKVDGKWEAAFEIVLT